MRKSDGPKLDDHAGDPPYPDRCRTAPGRRGRGSVDDAVQIMHAMRTDRLRPLSVAELRLVAGGRKAGRPQMDYLS